MEKIISVTEAARHFSDIINRTYYRNEVTVLIRSGIPVAKIVPVAPSETTGGMVAARWKMIHHLTREEAIAFQEDVEDSRARLNVPPGSPWA
ncbi:MAG: type II toxin-antitoxin system prevent-host-death family antitoxin [Planctomycetes bacterium]|nr:type II toxin-antitoxin system prevent-host-death family antitoxin [Planctomycetota bacterium]